MDAKRLKASVREILEDKSKAKNLLDILPCLRETPSSEAKCPRLKVVHAVQKALTHVIKRGDFDDGDNAKYKAWLAGVYDEAWNGLLSCVESTDKKLCVQAVSTLVHLWVAKGKGKTGFPIFPISLCLANVVQLDHFKPSFSLHWVRHEEAVVSSHNRSLI